VAIGGLNPREAEKVLNTAAVKKLNSPLMVVCGSKVLHLSYRDLGYRLDYQAALKKAQEASTAASWYRAAYQRLRNHFIPLKLDWQAEVDYEQALAVLRPIAAPHEREAADARLIIREDTVSVQPAVTGWRFDEDQALAKLKSLIPGEAGAVLRLQIVPVAPKISTREVQLMRISGLLASYSTNFNPAQENRTANIVTAAGALDNLLLAPGESFSFNQTVGPRTNDQGYLQAPVIINGELTPDLGGGVCQVSSTLYNAALLSNLQISERHNHSLPVGYVPLGRDATVSYGYLDLAFVNTTGSHILLKTEVQRDTLTVKVFGNTAAHPSDLSLETEVVEVLPPPETIIEDPNLPRGKTFTEQEGSAGYVTKTYLVRGTGTAKTRRLISQDRYNPKPTVLRAGSGGAKGVQKPQPENSAAE